MSRLRESFKRYRDVDPTCDSEEEETTSSLHKRALDSSSNDCEQCRTRQRINYPDINVNVRESLPPLPLMDLDVSGESEIRPTKQTPEQTPEPATELPIFNSNGSRIKYRRRIDFLVDQLIEQEVLRRRVGEVVAVVSSNGSGLPDCYPRGAGGHPLQDRPLMRPAKVVENSDFDSADVGQTSQKKTNLTHAEFFNVDNAGDDSSATREFDEISDEEEGVVIPTFTGPEKSLMEMD